MTIFPLAILCFFGLIFYTMGGSAISKNMTYSIRSDLAIPNKNVLLERPDIIQTMQNTFKEKKDGIKTIALTGIIGIGGAGKTTLARYYGRFMSDAKIVWELNAEKVESLISSFEDLAQALAKKSNERQEKLDNILNIANTQEKHKQLLFIMKSWLKEDGSWLLIYDNIDNITDIKDYLPQDPKVWGQGNVIITTRNTNIQTNQYLAQSDIVKIEELTNDEKLTLFSKIYYDKLPDKIPPHDKQMAEVFLRSIPPFPLDISSAACYLKSTNASFEQYLNNLKNPNSSFESTQESLLKEKGDYTRTRYNIITTSLQRMIDTRAEFAELALFIGLLDSQNIPIALLVNYGQSVDDFIINLKKYSLITSEASSLVGPTFSIHRSTQAIILAYLIQKFDLIKNKETLVKIANALERYMNALLDKEDYTKPKFVSDHYETFSSHNILGDDILGSMEAVLGGMYCEMEQYGPKTEQLLKNAIKKLEKHGNNNEDTQIRMARAKTNLGEVYGILGRYMESKNLLDDSLKIYQKYPKRQMGMGRTLRRLGDLYNFLGKYNETLDYLQQSIEFFEKNHDGVNVAHSKIYLGIAYKDLGQYKKAKDLLEESVNFYKDGYPEHHLLVTWGVAVLSDMSIALGDNINRSKDVLEEKLIQFKKYFGTDHPYVGWWGLKLGNAYRKCGDYEKAKNLIEESLAIHRKHYCKENIDIGLNLLYFGELYNDLGDYEKAKDCLNQCLAIYTKHYGEYHIQSAKAMSALGEAYSLKPEMFEQAEKELLKAKGILERENHPDIIIPLEILGDLYAKKADEKAKSIDFYKKALEMGSTYLPKNSIHITRLNKKLGQFKV